MVCAMTVTLNSETPHPGVPTMLRRSSDIAPSEITPRDLFERRREFLRDMALAGAAAGASALVLPSPRGPRKSSRM
jgi:hypothetical protein